MDTPKKIESSDGSVDTNSSIVSKSPGRTNLSFSLNFHLEAAISESSSDSDTAALRIDVAEVDDYELAPKRMRIEVDETSAIDEMEEEIERQLDAKAAKTNLTATNVKNILKHVITNEHVMAMVQNRLRNTDEGMVFEPKFTRAKAKELALTQPNMRWPITPIKKTSSLEVQELIEKDLSEDSSDEEYSPEQDAQSDDDAEADSLTSSDVDSQPSTPADSRDTSLTPEKQAPNDVHYDTDGIFKIPEIPHVPTEVESIGQRTRSKLCLSETPLEQIEQAFIPPDITTDMYDWDCDIDEDWGNFLNEFTKPLGQDPAVEDDPEADPEYNILEDKETDFLDKEELRMDKAVKVSRKELNNLVAELIEFEDMYSNQLFQVSKKPKKPSDSPFVPVSNTTTFQNNCTVNLLPAAPIDTEPPKLVTPEQVNLLATQLRQHVQLTTQHFAMTYMHPKLYRLAKIYKENLCSLSDLKDSSDSKFNVENLSDALKFMNDWETKLDDEKFRAEYTDFLTQEISKEAISQEKRHRHEPQFHHELVELIVGCKAFMYPQLLPHSSFRTWTPRHCQGAKYNIRDESLIALGLEEFTPLVAAKNTKFKKKNMQLMDVAQLISEHMLPNRSAKGIFSHIQMSRTSPRDNPIKHYHKTGSAPRMIHYITLNCELKAPKDQPRELLPRVWQEYIMQMRSRKRKYLREKRAQSLISRLVHAEPSPVTPVNSSLRNPIVNMLSGVSYTRDCSKNETEAAGESSEDGRRSIVESSVSVRSPQLRKTTPRLAKIRSAQNMKLMTQLSSTKPVSSYSRVKSRAKSESSKDSEESCGSSKGDNEDEIAELMLASTTIKKETASRKKAKQARELENIKRLREAENETAQEERDTKFAESYIQKLLVTLEANSMETLKAVIKTYSEYSEKFDTLSHALVADRSPSSENVEQSIEFKERQARIRDEKDILTINLYKDVCNNLRDYPELRSDFLLFLKPHHAAMIDQSTQHTMLLKMNEFMNVAQIYFAKQPSRLARVMKAITQLASDRYVTMTDVHAAMEPILRGHPLVMDLFLQVLPTGKPPDSLFASHLFENLTCPMGPYDKHKVYTEDSPELYESIEIPLPTSQEDPYGGDNCKCDCHDTLDSSSKTVTEHCVSCGTRFLNGKIYLQTSEGLRPAKITFPGDDEEEKLENIARVSLRTTERFASAPPTTSRRRKSSKNESCSDESAQKPCTAKNSPIKDSEDGDKSSKARRGARSPPKSVDQKKLARVNNDACTRIALVVQEPTSPLKSKRETRAERREAKLESKNVVNSDNCGTCDVAQSETSTGHWDDSAGGTSLDSGDAEARVSCEKMEITFTSSEDESFGNTQAPIELKAWTRHEDMILLQNIKKDNSESTFIAVSAMLGDRTVEQVKERFQTLLTLLEKMK